MKDVIDSIIKDIQYRYNQQVNESIRDDLVEILEQMIKSGDIIRYTTMPNMIYENEVLTVNEAQKLVYIPYQRVMELEDRVRELEKELRIATIDYDDLA